MPRLHIHLSDADRERLGYTEPLELHYLDLMQLEAEVLQKEIPGFDPDDWGGFLKDDKNLHWRKAILWCALRRQGVHIPYQELDFNRRAWDFTNPDAAEPEGKDESSTHDKTSSGNDEPTSPSSPTSTESSPSDQTETPSVP